jgi:hypothetical protein
VFPHLELFLNAGDSFFNQLYGVRPCFRGRTAEEFSLNTVPPIRHWVHLDVRVVQNRPIAAAQRKGEFKLPRMLVAGFRG